MADVHRFSTRLCRALIGNYSNDIMECNKILYRSSTRRKCIVEPSLCGPSAKAPSVTQIEDAIDYVIIKFQRYPCVHLGHWNMEYDHTYWYNVSETLRRHIYDKGNIRYITWGYKLEDENCMICILQIDIGFVATAKNMHLHKFSTKKEIPPNVASQCPWSRTNPAAAIQPEVRSRHRT